MVYCRGCGKEIHSTAPTCPHCGAQQIARAPAATGGTKSRIAAVVLALILGGFGAHKFYLGQVGHGIVYLLFCWTFIPAIVAFVEFVIYASMSDQAFAEKYG